MVVREGADVAKAIRRQNFLLDALVLMQQRLEIAENKAAELKVALDAKESLGSSDMNLKKEAADQKKSGER